MAEKVTVCLVINYPDLPFNFNITMLVSNMMKHCCGWVAACRLGYGNDSSDLAIEEVMLVICFQFFLCCSIFVIFIITA